VIVEPGLIASQKNRPGSEGGSMFSEYNYLLLDFYLGALAKITILILSDSGIDYKHNWQIYYG
jgi:hypothetical protein